jgi:hypothetical protein
MFMALSRSHFEVVKLLLENGARVDTPLGPELCALLGLEHNATMLAYADHEGLAGSLRVAIQEVEGNRGR